MTDKHNDLPQPSLCPTTHPYQQGTPNDHNPISKSAQGYLGEAAYTSCHAQDLGDKHQQSNVLNNTYMGLESNTKDKSFGFVSQKLGDKVNQESHSMLVDMFKNLNENRLVNTSDKQNKQSNHQNKS